MHAATQFMDQGIRKECGQRSGLRSQVHQKKSRQRKNRIQDRLHRRLVHDEDSCLRCRFQTVTIISFSFSFWYFLLPMHGSSDQKSQSAKYLYETTIAIAIHHTISMATATTERCPTTQFLHTPFYLEWIFCTHSNSLASRVQKPLTMFNNGGSLYLQWGP